MARPRITAGQARAMLARVNADLPKETNLDRACDLRILKMKLESYLRILSRQQSGPIVERSAPPGVTIH